MSLPGIFDLTGSNAIVTGGGTGLGLVFAEALAEAGANVVLCGRDEARCRAAATALEQAHGVRAIGMRCDVRVQDEAAAVVESTVSDLGSVDVLVNNAGTSWGAPAVDHSLEGWQKVIDVNLTGLFRMSQLAGRVMIEQGRGRIVNVASVAAFGAAPAELLDAVAYSASKGGVVSLTRDLAVKWAPYGLRVNAIAPGWFPTDMSRFVLERNNDAFLARIPLRRFGEPDDLKGALLLLASRASDFITGQTLIVDGGQSVA